MVGNKGEGKDKQWGWHIISDNGGDNGEIQKMELNNNIMNDDTIN